MHVRVCEPTLKGIFANYTRTSIFINYGTRANGTINP